METIFALFATLSFTACTKPVVTNKPVEPSVKKQVDFVVKPGVDYSTSVYSGLEEVMKLSVYRQHKNPYSTQLLWNTTITRRPLTPLPGSFVMPQIISKQFAGIKDSESKLTAEHAIVYYINGNISSQSFGYDFTPEGNSSKQFVVYY